jgi:hypothetical protein
MMEDPVILIKTVGNFEQGITYEKSAVLRVLGTDFGDCPFVPNTSVVEAVVDFLASMIVSDAKCPIYFLPESDINEMAVSLLGQISSDVSIPIQYQRKARLITERKKNRNTLIELCKVMTRSINFESQMQDYKVQYKMYPIQIHQSSGDAFVLIVEQKLTIRKVKMMIYETRKVPPGLAILSESGKELTNTRPTRNLQRFYSATSNHAASSQYQRGWLSDWFCHRRFKRRFGFRNGSGNRSSLEGSRLDGICDLHFSFDWKAHHTECDPFRSG